MHAASGVRLELKGCELDIIGVLDEEPHQILHLADIAVIDGGVEEDAQAEAFSALDIVEAKLVECLLALETLALLGQVNMKGNVQEADGREVF